MSSQVWPNCKIRCFFMFGLANRDLPTTLLPLSILNMMLVGSEPIVQPWVQMYSSWGDKCPFSVFSTHVPAVESMRSQWWVYKMLFVVQFEVVFSTMETQDFGWIYITIDTTEHIKCALVSQVWPNCKTRCFSCLDLQIGLFRLHDFHSRYWTWWWLVRNQWFSLGFRCIAVGGTNVHFPFFHSCTGGWVYGVPVSI